MKWNKKVKNLVIGGNLAALEFAFREGFPVFYDKLEVPFRLEQTKEGTNKKDLIQNYAFLLSINRHVFGIRPSEDRSMDSIRKMIAEKAEDL